MKNLLFVLILTFSFSFSSGSESTNDANFCSDLKLEEKSSNLTLQILNSYEAQKEILKYIEIKKGFLKERQERFLVVSIPTCELSGILEDLSKQYNLIDKGITTQSLSWDHKQKTDILSSKESLLQDYFDLLKESDSGSFLEVEREIQQLTNEIESLKSSIEEIEFRASYSEMRIMFNEVDQRQRITNFQSSFAWINGLNLVDLMRDFE